jgi:hypothetical protein
MQMAMQRSTPRKQTSRPGALFEMMEPRQLLSISPFVGPLQIPADAKSGAITVKLSGGANSTTSTRSGDKSPLFDFTDAFYLANGINPANIVAREDGTGPNSVIDQATDPTRRNVRITRAIGAHSDNGSPILWSVFGVLFQNAFTNNAAGQRARQIAEQFTFYVFPKAGTNPLSPAVKRQDDLIPLNNGYFSNDPLGMWRASFVNFVPGSMNSGNGRRVAQEIIARNGTDADGTPFIRTFNDLQEAQQAGIVTVVSPNPDGSQGPRWILCPVYKDVRDGAITRDAHLEIVRNADGTAHSSARDIEQLFLQSQGQTGDGGGGGSGSGFSGAIGSGREGSNSGPN